MLYLKEANTDDLEAEWRYVRDMPEDENGLTNAWHGVTREEFAQKALPEMIRFSRGVGLPDWMVPETFLFLWNDGEIVGQFRVRHRLNDSLREGAGHIGYGVAKPFRGRGFATEGLRLALEIAQSIVPEDEFYLRVNRDNPASLRVMLKNGGRIVGENGEKYFVRIPNPRGRKKPALSVRRAGERDIPAVLRLLVQVNMVHHNGRPDLFKGPTTKYSAEELRDIFASDRTPVFVCVDENDAVLGHGFCVMQHSGGRLLEELDTLYIDDICVDEAARGRGVGRALFDHIRAFARAAGCYNLTLNVWTCNPGAMRFYERLGLAPYKTGMEMIL